MPIISTDDFTATVIVNVQAEVEMYDETRHVTTVPNAVASQIFRFRPGKPLATAFQVTWYGDARRSVTTGALPTVVEIDPPNPQEDKAGNALTISDARTWIDGVIKSRMPGESSNPAEGIDEDTTFYGRIGIDQPRD